MIEQLTEQQRQKFELIIFTNNHTAEETAEDLSDQQKKKFKVIFDQKLAYEAAHKKIKPPNLGSDDKNQVDEPTTPNFLGTLCCCLYPENNKESFDVDDTFFLKRFFGIFLFWRKNFLKIGAQKNDLYGPVWLYLGYIVLLGLCSNMNNYFVNSFEFKYDRTTYLNAIGVSGFLIIIELLIYTNVIKCLGGYIASEQLLTLMGYSFLLYYIPTLFCVLPTVLWHVTALAVAAFTRAVFLYRNVSEKLESRTYILMLLFAMTEGFYLYLMLQTSFRRFSGYNYEDGIKQLTSAGSRTTSGSGAAAVASSNPNHNFALHMRSFDDFY